jgi:hypothetical protein
MARTTVQHVNSDDMALDEFKLKVEEYNHELGRVVGDESCVVDGDGFHNFVNG